MSLNLNRVMLAGNLTRDPQVRTAGKSIVCDFGLAINRKYKQGDEKKEETTFVDVECWGTTAELCGQYLVKGRGAYIEGRLKLDQWEDKESGQKRSKIKIVAEMVQFLSDGKGNRDDAPIAQSSSKDVEPAPTRPKAAAPVADEVPF